ncbi:type I glyceraldehyde-3-phosphate dehydrogenase [Leeia oryzae]|uniref:type I glyceraldehyde-3-phosphate dehydrogenase n=1 Tax=Leeia oryzae TaxID=356662 RepID=UPI000360BD6A|nr:type I glyceraldehyde-3-phosphate dehydrogenase [Leeia oryzae]
MIRIAINGYGRIGRNVLRALYETNRRSEFKLVAINASGDLATNAHLTKFDTVHGRFPFDVKADADGNWMRINDENIRFFSTRNPAELPWGELGVDVVLECTGAFTSKAKAKVHLDAGARKVLISAPGDKDVDATIVMGVNEHVLRPEHTVVSNASCTTNCLAPVAKVLHEGIGIQKGVMTTIHAYTNDQVLTDVRHKDLRRARSATMSMIPTKTGAAAAVGLVLPELNGRLDGFAVRVPTINVSMVDLSVILSRDTTKEEVNQLMANAANGPMKGILDYTDLPLVSVDFNHTPASSTFDATLTKVVDGNLLKVSAWYDNEWGYSCRMLDAAKALASV